MTGIKGWLGDWITPILAIAMVGALAPAVVEFYKTTGSDYSHIQAPPPDELVRQITQVEEVMKAPPASTPDAYYHTVVQAETLKVYADDYVATNRLPMQDTQYGVIRAYVTLMQPLIDPYQMSYLGRFGSGAMSEASVRNQALIDHLHQVESSAYVHVDGSTLARAAILSYLLSVGFAMLFFVARLKDKRMAVWPDLDRILAFATVWPWAVFKYPTNLEPIAQARRLLQRLGWALSALLTVSAVGAQAQTRSGDDVPDNSNVRVLAPSEIPMPSFSFSTGIETDKVTGNGDLVHLGPVGWVDANAAFKDGLTFDFWASRAASGSKGSDENDYMVSKTWTKGPDTVTAGLAYFDIQPVNRSRDGDMISPFGEIDYPLGHDVKAFTRLDVYLLTAGPPGRNGILITEGAHFKTLDLGHGFHFDQTTSAVYANGPFGQAPGVSLRYDGTLTAHVTKRVTATLLDLKAWVPIKGARGRPATFSFGAGLSLAF